jgi:hypothetical protein
MGLSMSICYFFNHVVATMTLNHIVATVTLDTFVAFDTTVEFVIPLFALLPSLPMTWHKEHIWNFLYSKEYTFPILLCDIEVIIHSIMHAGPILCTLTIQGHLQLS